MLCSLINLFIHGCLMIKNEQTRIFKQLLLITDLTSHILSTIPVQARKSCRTSLWENSLIDSFKNRKIWKSYSAGTQAFMLTNKLVNRLIGVCVTLVPPCHRCAQLHCCRWLMFDTEWKNVTVHIHSSSTKEQ